MKNLISLICIALLSVYLVNKRDELDDKNINQVKKLKSQEIESVEFQSDNSVKIENLTENDVFNRCSAFLTLEDLSLLKPAKIVQIKQVLRSLVEAGESEYMLNSLSYLAGLDQKNSRMLRLPSDDFTIVPRYDDANLIPPKIKEYVLLVSADKTGDIEPILTAIEQNTFPKNIFYHTEGNAISLFSFLIKTAPQVDNELIDRIINNNVIISMADLAYLSRHGFPLNIIKQVYYASSVQVDSVLVHLGTKNSLSLIALKGNNLELANFWAMEGSPNEVGFRSANAFDLLLEQPNYNDSPYFQQLFDLFQQQNLLPNFPENLVKLKPLVSNQIFSSYQDSYEHKFPVLDDNIFLIIDELHLLMLEGLVSYDPKIIPRHECFILNGIELSQKITSGLSSNFLNFKTSMPKIELPFKQFYELSDSSEPVKQARDIYDVPLDIIKHLSVDKSLKSKRNVDIYRYELLGDISQQLSKTIEVNEQLRVTIAEVFELVKQGLWQQARNLLAQIEGDKQEGLQTLIMFAITTNGDFNFIKALLNEGAMLPENIIYHLIIQDNTELTKKLLPYGLKLSFNNPLLFDSPLAISVQRRAFNMMNLLIEQGSNLTVDYGYDALDRALQNISASNINFPFVHTLLLAGAKIDVSHREIVSQIKSNNVELYLKFIALYPQFL